MCPQWQFGIDCEDQCDCINALECDSVTGECICRPGFFGPACNEGKKDAPYMISALHSLEYFPLAFLTSVLECPEGRYGPDCMLQCTCENGATCDPASGLCNCTSGWTNVKCDQRNLSLPITLLIRFRSTKHPLLLCSLSSRFVRRQLRLALRLQEQCRVRSLHRRVHLHCRMAR